MGSAAFQSLVTPAANGTPVEQLPLQNRSSSYSHKRFEPSVARLIVHQSAITAGQWILSQCIKTRLLNRHRAELEKPYLIACSHVSHLEPFIVSCLLNRKIDWMARIEFFKPAWAAKLLDCADSFSVNRQGVPVSTIRTSLDRLSQNRIVGIFPEGGVARGAENIFRGGIVKEGACLIAQRAGVPIVPIVVLGTEKLNCVDPWLPMRRGRLWINVGHPVRPLPDVPCRRSARKLLAQRLRQRFMLTYQELLHSCKLDDTIAP